MGDRRFLAALVTAYVVGLAVVVTSPWGWELNRLTVRLYVFFRVDWPIAPESIGPEHYGVLLNVLLFMPLGVLLAAATGRPWWWVGLAALAGSALAELVQWGWLARDGSWSDVVANTLGGLVGAVAVSLLGRPRSRRAGRRGRRRPG